MDVKQREAVMGGRGGSSGMVHAAEVTFDGNKTEYYFTQRNGINYMQRTISGTPEPTPGNISAKTFLERARSNGAEVRKISAKERAEKKKAHEEDRRKTNEFLNHQSASDRMMAKGSREARKRNRAGRR